MRLLNTSTFALKEFEGAIPPYAILSHTWGSEEVTFQHLRDSVSEASKLPAFSKIEGCCRQAILAGYDWVWIDTCCIDKSSAAEISEAINSMYGWYQRSAVCFVYLADVPRFRMTDSRWFDRGWTLQELIAPSYVEFYTSDWLEIGTRASLEGVLSSATGIPVDILRGASPTKCTAAERLSWASGRQTTKPEDEAYCLLGLFNINMPILYGEGAKAFERLQQEILTKSEDFTLLAWSPTVNQRSHSPCVGVLAPNPTVFKRPDLTSHLPSTAFGFDDAESMLFADMGALEWADLQPHPADSRTTSLPVHQLLFDPPLATGRGISVTLPIDTDELDMPGMPGTEPGHAESGERDVLAWIYTNVLASHVGSSSSLGSSRGSWGTRRSSVEGGVMICIWLTITTDSNNAPARAVRTPDRGPVCVPNMFMSRFKPRHVYLQLGQDSLKTAPLVPQKRQIWGTSWERALGVTFNGCQGARQLNIVSHYPPAAIIQHPVVGKQAPSAGRLAPTRTGSLWGFHASQFELVLSGGRIMDASGALRLSLGATSPETPSDDFVVLFGHSSATEQLHCHLEPLDQADLDARERDFWNQFLWRRKPRRNIHDASGVPSDRSSLLLPCGVAVTAAAKQRQIDSLGGVVPALILTTISDGDDALTNLDRLLSIN